MNFSKIFLRNDNIILLLIIGVYLVY